MYSQLSNIITELFFPPKNPELAEISFWAVYAVGYLARPLGAVIFGHVGDSHGRRLTLLISVLLITLPTLLIGCLPTYAHIGLAAPILMALLRFVQGVAVGGEVRRRPARCSLAGWLAANRAETGCTCVSLCSARAMIVVRDMIVGLPGSLPHHVPCLLPAAVCRQFGSAITYLYEMAPVGRKGSTASFGQVAVSPVSGTVTNHTATSCCL